MPKRTHQSTGSQLFIVDNSAEDWKALRYLRDWCRLSKAIDIATGYFEIGALLALDGTWQKLDSIRILMGDEVSLRTKKAFASKLQETATRLDRSLEDEKDRNPFLTGAKAIVSAMQSGRITCRVYRKDKFHAKAYITHAKEEVYGASALVGSSNMTFPGLTQNVELNVQITGGPVSVLQEWYEEYWNEAEDVTPEILQTVTRHTPEHPPFRIYARALQQIFHARTGTATEWEEHESKIWPDLARYQQEGYKTLITRAKKYSGAFLCDGVGLGKTFVGLMLIERFARHERKNVALFVPKAAREPVWEKELKERLPGLSGGFGSNFKMFSHTDLGRAKLDDELAEVKEQADVVIIDEAHHFRNTGSKGDRDAGKSPSRYWQMYDLLAGKQVFLLTATPINNSLDDIRHMIELFSRGRENYFSGTLAIHSLKKHVRDLDKQIQQDMDGTNPDTGDAADTDAQEEPAGRSVTMADADTVLHTDTLFRELVLQRSRQYVKQSTEQAQSDAGEVTFPTRRPPQVVPYSLAETYGPLLDMMQAAFHKQNPLFTLPVYNRYAWYTGDDDSIDLTLEKGRRKQVVALIRTNFLKRFESSAEAFRRSCRNLLAKLLRWLDANVKTPAELEKRARWRARHAGLIGEDRDPDDSDRDPDAGEDGDDGDEAADGLDSDMRLDRTQFDVGTIIDETIKDLDQLADFLTALEKISPAQDTKIQALKTLLRDDPDLGRHKLLIFTEFKDTAEYIARELAAAGVPGTHVIHSGSKDNRLETIRRFAPYYNGSSSPELQEKHRPEIRVLISTDVLSEGLNLQDATRLINYDLHWNPVRLMQRIGRIDRRMNPRIEDKITTDHPEQKAMRGTVAYWNFLPPGELDDLLSLYQTVSHKTLRISATLGIESGKLLHPDDHFNDTIVLQDFDKKHNGTTPEEKLRLEYEKLLKRHPGLEEELHALPNGVFSGKEHPKPGTRAVFFCYALPGREEPADGETRWTLEAGEVRWYLYDLASDRIMDNATEIDAFIRCLPDTPRTLTITKESLHAARAKVSAHITRSWFRPRQAPADTTPTLKAWLELN